MISQIKIFVRCSLKFPLHVKSAQKYYVSILRCSWTGNRYLAIIDRRMFCSEFTILEPGNNSVCTVYDKKNTHINKMSISYNNTFILNASNTKFLGLVIANSLCWNNYITQLIPRLSIACYVLRSIRPFMSQDALKTVYHSYLHSLISYGIIFWGNSSYSPHIVRLQKKAVRNITGSRPRDSFRELFKWLRIRPVQFFPFNICCGQ